jgi:allantoinase
VGGRNQTLLNMAELDLVICGGTVVTADGERLADLGVADGQIVAVEVGLRDQARETIDATGLHIFPGLIDSARSLQRAGPNGLGRH